MCSRVLISSRCLALSAVLAHLGLGLVSADVPGHLERGFSVEPVPSNVREKEGFNAAESAGLFVGVHRFDDDPFPPVLFAVDDAVDLAHLFALELELIAPGNVVLALSGEPSKPGSLGRLEKLLQAGAVRRGATQSRIYDQLFTLGQSTGERGLFVVAAATHGVSNGDGDFLVSSDALSWLLPRTGVAVDEVFSIVSKATAPRRLVLLDACRERGTGANARGVRAGAEMSPSFVDAISQASGQVVLFGATRGGFAYDDPDRGNGVFAAAVLDGLRGEAPSDERFFITAGTLSGYVHDRVLDWVRQNRPEHLGRSRGISTHLEGGAAEIPLAFDPRGHEVLEEYRRRLDGALVRLRQNIGGPQDPDNPITGAIYDKIVGVLSSSYPTPQVQELLEAAEALDGGIHTQRGLVYVYERYAADFGKTRLGPLRESHRLKPPQENRTRRRLIPRQGDLWKDPVIGMEFFYSAPGAFSAGSPEEEAGRDEDETRHRVILERGFWMAKTEVNMVQFARFVAETGYVTEAEREGFSKVFEEGSWKRKEGVNWRDSGELESGAPVAHVSWNDARAFAAWLSERTGKRARLPTEAEWEYAARAGTSEATYAGDLSIEGSCVAPELEEIAWFCGNSGASAQAVAQKKANPWGYHDMLGNVSEWVEDGFGFYPEGTVTDPAGPEDRPTRVVRGGSAYFAARSARAAARSGLDPSDRYSYLGFRVVLSSAR